MVERDTVSQAVGQARVCTPALRHYELTVGKRAEAEYVLAGQEAAGEWEDGLLERLRLALCPRGKAPAFLQLRLLPRPAAAGRQQQHHPAGDLLAHCLGDGGPRQLGVLLGLRSLPVGHSADAERARLRAWSASLRRVFAATSCSGRKVWFRSFAFAGYLPEEPRFDLRELLEVQRSCWHGLCSLASPVHCAQLWLLDGEGTRNNLPSVALPAAARGKFSLVRRFRSPRGELAYAVREMELYLTPYEVALLKGKGGWAEKSGLVSRSVWTWLVCSGLLPGAASAEPLALLNGRHGGHLPWPYAMPWFAKAEERRLLLNYAVMIWAVLRAVARTGERIPRQDMRLLELRRVLERLKRERAYLWGYVLQDNSRRLLAQRLVAQLPVLLDTALSQAYDEAR
eukprot:g44814.t1